MSQVILMAWLARFFCFNFLCARNPRVFYFLAGKSPVQPLLWLSAPLISNAALIALLTLASAFFILSVMTLFA
jgi:hypothetical protein